MGPLRAFFLRIRSRRGHQIAAVAAARKLAVLCWHLLTKMPITSGHARPWLRTSLDGEVPDHSTFSKNRHGRFRDSHLLRRLFETVLQRCIDKGLVGGDGFAVDASLIQADARDRTRVEGATGLPPGGGIGRKTAAEDIVY